MSAKPVDHTLKPPVEMLFERPIVTLLRHSLGHESYRDALGSRKEAMITQDNHANNSQLSTL